jgi:lactoylglutathione lyase
MFAGIGHVAFQARDLGTLLEFYRDTLGLAEMFRLLHDDGGVRLAYLRVTDEHYLELFPNGAERVAQPPRAAGYSHLCLTVEDMDAAVAELERRGVVLTQGIKTGLDGNRQAWIADPEGNRIELMEMARDSHQAQAIERLRSGGA